MMLCAMPVVPLSSVESAKLLSGYHLRCADGTKVIGRLDKITNNTLLFAFERDIELRRQTARGPRECLFRVLAITRVGEAWKDWWDFVWEITPVHESAD